MSPQQASLLGDPDDRVVDVDIADRMEQAFLDYSMSVIVGRALPDVTDGLKPVQRRILYAMWEAGLRPGRPYRKCASAVGDVMKKYHPHGDSSIYEALVRMAQDFSSRVPLVDGQGNFGSVDGDPPAAMRYTECRLTPAAMALLDGIDEETVDLADNYDGYEQEPIVLPARLPNLLANGASGIAVGMATNIPPHNLGELVKACRHLIKRPDATVDDLMRHVPAPDFPTGARILATEGLRDTYLTGRGKIVMEAVATTETRSGGLPRIVVTELPFQVNKATLVEKIADLVKSRKVEQVRDLRDESSRDGMRIVIELKRGEDPRRVLQRLTKLTDLRTNFNANMVALVGGQPRTIGLVEALTCYLAHQRDVLTRRTRYRRERAAARAHVLEGLLIALDAIDEVIALIRAAETPDVARTGLMERFELTEVQATAILDMQLRRLAALERERLATELAELRSLIAELDMILGDPAELDRLLDAELAALAKEHGDARRSRIVGGEPSGDGEEGAGAGAATLAGEPPPVTLEAQSVFVTVTRASYLRAITERRQSPAHGTPRDPLVAGLRTTTETTLLLVDAEGGGVRIETSLLPVVTARQRGVTVAQLVGDAVSADVIGALVLEDAEHVLTVSANGLVKRTERAEYEGRTRAMIAAGVKDDDELVALLGCADGDQVLLAHDGGQVVRFGVDDVRPMGRSAAGVAGLQVPARARLVTASVIPGGSDDSEVVTLGADGSAKRTPLGEYPVQGRGGKGVQTGAAALAWCGLAEVLHVPTADEWTVVRAELLELVKRGTSVGPVLPPVTGVAVPERG